jgi:hypothetical protein
MTPSPKDVCALIPGISKYAKLRGKGELNLQKKLRLLITCPQNRGIMLDYLGESNISYNNGP